MGKFSRDKGARGERSFRDAAIQSGYTARRIPLSGAIKGYKGDVAFEKDGKAFKAEVKCRKEAFKRLYEYMSKQKNATHGLIIDKDPLGRICVIGVNLEEVLNYNGHYVANPTDKDYLLIAMKLANLHELLGEADLLCLKDDRKSFIYVRYL